MAYAITAGLIIVGSILIGIVIGFLIAANAKPRLPW